VIAFMQAVAQREMQAYDYSLDPIRLSLRERVLFTFYDLPVNLTRMAAWQYREALLDRRGRSVPSYRIIPDTGTISVL
jgi:hypothetical protein